MAGGIQLHVLDKMMLADKLTFIRTYPELRELYFAGH